MAATAMSMATSSTSPHGGSALAGRVPDGHGAAASEGRGGAWRGHGRASWKMEGDVERRRPFLSNGDDEICVAAGFRVRGGGGPAGLLLCAAPLPTAMWANAAAAGEGMAWPGTPNMFPGGGRRQGQRGGRAGAWWLVTAGARGGEVAGGCSKIFFSADR
ncbi:unnamed protein product [Urochloa humidicola]